jgi:hypothetical protein
MDIAMRFEDTVNSIWGKPEIPTYFSGYYNLGNGTAFKSILLALCIYALNYNRSKYDEESIQVLSDYQTIAISGESSHTDDIKFLKFLYKKNVPYPRDWE